jgi:hypothetical protein
LTHFTYCPWFVALVQGQLVAICDRTIAANAGSLHAAATFVADAAIRPTTAESTRALVTFMTSSVIVSSRDP